MKISQFVSFLAIISVLGLSSCSKKSDDAVTPSQSSVVDFKVKIDGKAYAPDYAYALASSPGTNGYYAIYGLNSQTSDVVALALPTTTATGTYTLSDVNFGTITLNKEEYSTINGGTGTITIATKTTTSMSGTFSFTAYDATGTKKLTLTEGSFNVNIR